MLVETAHTMDDLMKKRLLSVSHVHSTFLSALVQQLCVTLQGEHRSQSEKEADMAFQLQEIQTILSHQRHDSELTLVYICFTISLNSDWHVQP